MIDVSGVAVQAGQRILLTDLSVHVKAGEILAVLGPNGRGKTTLLRTVLGLQKPAAGKVTLGGHAAYVPQQSDALFSYDVLNVVTMGRVRHLPWYGTPGVKDVDIAYRALDAVGLTRLAHQSYRALSGGERQLVSIARAIASDSPIMLLDEPAAALDLYNQDIILSILKSLAHDRGLAIVFTTHHPQHAQHIADQTLLMHTQAGEVGPTAHMCTDAALSRLYNLPVRTVVLHDDGREVAGIIPMFR